MKCGTNGKNCKGKPDGEPGEVTFYYNGAMLVETDFLGSRQRPRREEAPQDGVGREDHGDRGSARESGGSDGEVGLRKAGRR